MNAGYNLDFLSVGEESKSGDAIALRFGNLFGNREEQFVIVIDGGTHESGERLVNHIRTVYMTDKVDLVINSHPDNDHAMGLLTVIENLTVNCLWMHTPWANVKNSSIQKEMKNFIRKSMNTASRLYETAQNHNVHVRQPFRGLYIDFPPFGSIRVLGPTEFYYQNLIPDFRCFATEIHSSSSYSILSKSSDHENHPNEFWDGETLNREREDLTSAENKSSTIISVQVVDQNFIFTGDAGVESLQSAIDYADQLSIPFNTSSIFQIPHHGSRHNITTSILDQIFGPVQSYPPTESSIRSVISAATEGRPSHPSKHVINALCRRGSAPYTTQGENLHFFLNAPSIDGGYEAKREVFNCLSRRGSQG
jgi:beta-lactamase superfamily II metal-dependent hydrolase